MLIMAGRKREWRAQTRQKLRRLVMLARQSEPPGSVAAALVVNLRTSYDLMRPRRASYHLLETVALGV